MTDVETFCRAIYDETNDIFASVASSLHDVRGFRILYGPPFVGASYLFLGYQPGGRKETPEEWRAKGFHDGWPEVSDYVGEQWPLARQLRTIFGAETLEWCSGLNAIFFQSPTVREWKKNDRSLIAELEEFSIGRAQQIVSALKPKSIVVIGLGTFNLLGVDGDVVLQDGKRALVRHGDLWGIPAFGIVHLSGARVSREQIGAIRKILCRQKFKLRHYPWPVWLDQPCVIGMDWEPLERFRLRRIRSSLKNRAVASAYGSRGEPD